MLFTTLLFGRLGFPEATAVLLHRKDLGVTKQLLLELVGVPAPLSRDR